jgi:hypothetical protein
MPGICFPQLNTLSLRMPQVLTRALFLMFALVVSTALAQSSGTSTLQGTVADSTGAIVPGAQVVVTNVETGVSRTETTNEDGFYSAQSLQGGNYRLTVTKAGFKKSNVQAIHLSPSTVLGVNPVLTVGDVSSEVTVTADAVSVQTETSESGGTIPGREVSQLMLNGRNFQTLATIVPGVTSVQGANQLTVGGAAPSAEVQISVGGTSVEQTAYFVDGVYDSSGLGLFVLPTIDSIQEFRILKGNYGANYGFVGSGQVLVQTRSGGKQFHGTLYDYIRNNNIGTAKNFFYKQGTPYGLHQNIFGYSLGGPVVIPHLYNNDRAKTFFFASGEWHLTNSSQALTRAFFPQPMRTGDFSASPTIPTSGNLSLDANSKALLAARGVNPATCLSAGAGGKVNQINTSCMDPVAVSLMNAYFPLPNDVIPGQFNNYVNTNPQRLFDSSVLYRIDHTINDKNQLMGRVMYEEANIQLAARNYNDPAPNPGAANYSTGLNAMIRWTTTPNSHITNNVQIAETYLKGKNSLSGNYTLPSGTTIPLPLGPDPLNRIPSMQINGGWNWLGVGAYPTYNNNGIGSISDDFSWLRGKHSLQMGGIYMIGITRANVATGNVPQGNYAFTGVHTGDPAADYLLGLDATFVQINSQRDGVFHYRWFEGYVQDDFHATPRFVANLGVRWSWYGPTTREGNQLANFNPSTFDPTQAPIVNTNGSLVTNPAGVPVTTSGSAANLTNGLVIAGQNGVPDGVINPRHSYFAPRIGFAYQITGDGKTSVHGGYGIAYTQVSQQNTVILLPNPPYTKNISITNSLLSNPSAGTAAAPSVQSLQAIGYDFRAGLIQTFSLTLEREVVPHGVLSLAYAGNTQQHTLSSQLDANFPLATTTPGTPACAAASPTAETSGSYQFDPCLNLGAARAYYRPYKGYDQILSTMSGGSGNYNSLQAGFVYRTTDITLNGAYTFSKSLSDVVPANPGSNGGSGVGYDSAATFQNSRDVAAEYGRPDYDRAHVFTSAIVYQLPFFKTSSNFFEHELLSGWGLSGLAILESGFALTPSDTYGDAGLATRPDQLEAAKTHGSGKIGIGEPNYFVDPVGMYRKPAYGFFGNARNGSLVGPKEVSFDVSATKAFPFYKTFNGELRVEAFNVLNHPNITSISTQFGAANFGQAISAGDPRIMEAAFRLNF